MRYEICSDMSQRVSLNYILCKRDMVKKIIPLKIQMFMMSKMQVQENDISGRMFRRPS